MAIFHLPFINRRKNQKGFKLSYPLSHIAGLAYRTMIRSWSWWGAKCKNKITVFKLIYFPHLVHFPHIQLIFHTFKTESALKMFLHEGEFSLKSVNLNVKSKSKSKWFNECHTEYLGNMQMHNHAQTTDDRSARTRLIVSHSGFWSCRRNRTGGFGSCKGCSSGGDSWYRLHP